MAPAKQRAATDPPADEESTAAANNAPAQDDAPRERVIREEPGHARLVVDLESPHDFAPATPKTVAQRRAEQAELYGTWTATAMIREPVTGANMFAPGDPVPVSHVDRFPDLFIEGQNIERTQKTEG